MGEQRLQLNCLAIMSDSALGIAASKSRHGKADEGAGIFWIKLYGFLKRCTRFFMSASFKVRLALCRSLK